MYAPYNVIFWFDSRKITYGIVMMYSFHDTWAWKKLIGLPFFLAVVLLILFPIRDLLGLPSTQLT